MPTNPSGPPVTPYPPKDPPQPAETTQGSAGPLPRGTVLTSSDGRIIGVSNGNRVLSVDGDTVDEVPPDVPEGTCSLCGKPMPEGEEMFKYHGYSGPCPKDEETA